jgi:hypothetical protein
MIRSIKVTNYLDDSIKIDLSNPESSGLIVKSISGLGPGTSNINVTEVSTNDGGLYNSSRISTRNIVISLVFSEDSSIENSRYLSYKYFPLKKKIKLLIETDTRQAEIEGYVESNDPNIFSKQEGTDISIICPDPFFYSTEENGKNVTVFSGIEPMFEFPFGNESLTEDLIEVGSIQNKTENVITYTGDAEIGVVITIHAVGDAKNITIYNSGTREVMNIDSDKLESLTGSGIVSGDDIVISTLKGKKSITLNRNGENVNILNCLGDKNDWFQLSKGDNIFAYTAESGSSNLQFKIENQIAYEGV